MERKGNSTWQSLDKQTLEVNPFMGHDDRCGMQLLYLVHTTVEK